MDANSRNKDIFSPLNFTYDLIKSPEVGVINLKTTEESFLSQISCEKNSAQYNIKKFSQCSPATLNYLKHNWSSDNNENNSVNDSIEILHASKNTTNNKVFDKKIKYISDCSPMTQNTMMNYNIKYFEPQYTVDSLTLSENLNSTTQKFKKIANNMQSFFLSDSYTEELLHSGQDKNKENIYFYLKTNSVSASTSFSKLLNSASSNLSNNNSDEETLLLSQLSPINVLQKSQLKDDKFHSKKSSSPKRNQLEMKKPPYLLSNLCCEYDAYKNKILCEPKMKICNKNHLKTMKMNEIKHIILQNISFLEKDLV